jgi:hypothetical protein
MPFVVGGQSSAALDIIHLHALWFALCHRDGSQYVAVMRRSRSRACVLVLLPHLSSTSYLSCIIDTSCNQTLLLPPWRPAQAEQHDRTIHNTLFSPHSTLQHSTFCNIYIQRRDCSLCTRRTHHHTSIIQRTPGNSLIGLHEKHLPNILHVLSDHQPRLPAESATVELLAFVSHVDAFSFSLIGSCTTYTIALLRSSSA